MDRIERSYYPNGTLQKEVHYRGETKHGASRSWHPNGVLAEEYWFDDDPKGNWIDRTWYESGTLKSEMSFVNGRESGRFTVWKENGSVLYRHYAIDARKVSKARYHEACKTRPELPRYPDDESGADQIDSNPKTKKKPPAKNSKTSLSSSCAAEELPPSDDPFFQHMLATQRAEALQWLRQDSASTPITLGELDIDAAVDFVNRLYDSGARSVIAVEIDVDPVGQGQSTNHLLVHLPNDDDARKALFEIENEHSTSEGFDGETDTGQHYLYFKMC